MKISPIIRTTVGKVVKFKKDKGYGWIVLDDERWKDAFVSYRDIEPDEEGKRCLNEKELVKFNLHENEKGYIAKEVTRLTSNEFEQFKIING